MKLLYATSITYPSFQTNRIQILQMSQMFSTLLRRENFTLAGYKITLKESGYNLITKSFAGSKRSFILAWRYLIFSKEHGYTHLYCREERLLFFLLIYNKIFFRQHVKFIYEAHDIPDSSWIQKYLLIYATRIIVLTSYIKKEFVRIGISPDKILISPDGVNLQKFDINITKEEARSFLNLPLDKRIIMYTGQLYEWKGVQKLANASIYMSANTEIVFVGGKAHHAEGFIKKNYRYNNIRALGQRPHVEIPLYLRAADVVVLPNTAKENISKYYTSPMKLFEYMASKTPIVASDLPSIREILSEKNACLVIPDDEKALAAGILKVLNEEEYARDLSEHALKKVKKYTWIKRAENIIQFCK